MQVSLYLNDGLAKEVSAVAKARGLSVSGYISEALRRHIGSAYSPTFLSSLGSLADVDMVRPKQPSFSDDADRDKL
jgi:hypothetical protein